MKIGMRCIVFVILLIGCSNVDAQSIYGKWEVQYSPQYFYLFSGTQKVSFDISKEQCIVTSIRKTPSMRGKDTNGVLHIDTPKTLIEIDSFRVLSVRPAEDTLSGVIILAKKEGGLSKTVIYSAFAYKIVDSDHLILGRYRRPNFAALEILEKNLPDTTTNPRSLLISSRKVEELSKLKNITTISKSETLSILAEYYKFVSDNLAEARASRFDDNEGDKWNFKTSVMLSSLLERMGYNSTVVNGLLQVFYPWKDDADITKGLKEIFLLTDPDSTHPRK